jgi:hypothetical protein
MAKWVDEYLASLGVTQEVGLPRPSFERDGRSHWYDTLTLAGVGDEVATPRFLASDGIEAKRRYLEVLAAYLDGRKHIVWRIRPEVAKLRGGKRWAVYSRLVAL